MGTPERIPVFSLDDFLTWEAQQSERHEYLDGEVFAMTGARDAHNTIAGNLFAHLRNALRGGPCRAFIADMKLRVDAANAVFYPDVMVTCDARDRAPEADLAKQHPCLIVEVLSEHDSPRLVKPEPPPEGAKSFLGRPGERLETSAAYDRGLKFERYRLLETLSEYVLIEQDRPRVDVFRREGARWLLESYGTEAGQENTADLGFDLTSVGARVTLGMLYEDVDFTPAA